MTLKQESTESEKNLNNVIKIDPRQIRNHLDQMVRGTVAYRYDGAVFFREKAQIRGCL